MELPSAELRSTDDNQDRDAVTRRNQLFGSKVVKFEMCVPSEWRFYQLVGYVNPGSSYEGRIQAEAINVGFGMKQKCGHTDKEEKH